MTLPRRGEIRAAKSKTAMQKFVSKPRRIRALVRISVLLGLIAGGVWLATPNLIG